MFFSSVLVGCVSIQPPLVSAPAENPINNWARVLTKHVNEQGQIDFKSVKAEPDDLYAYVDYASRVDPSIDTTNFESREEKLAHFLNVYNAMAMYAVIELGIPKTNAGLAKVSFFFLKRYKIANKFQTLHAYEKMIRELGDPRVHFFLNCMSVGCPRLPQKPITAETLDETLDREAKRFFADPEKLRVDDQSQTLYLSEILKFYTPEFLAKANGLIAYVNQYVEKPIPENYKIEFIPYDWTINQS